MRSAGQLCVAAPGAALEKVPAKVSVSAVAHAARPVAGCRPSAKRGMTESERHRHPRLYAEVPFDGPAPDLWPECVQRQTGL